MKNSSWLPEEEDFKGLSDNFFDDFISHIDFPLEDIETANDEGDWDAGFQNLVPPPLDVLTSLSSEFTCKGPGVQKPLPVKQSSSSEVSATTDGFPHDVKVLKLFQSSSPVSVLESINGSVMSQIQNRAQRLAFLVKGVRSKRKRPTIQRISLLKSFASAMCFGLDDLESETYLSDENTTKKKRKRNKSCPSQSPESLNTTGGVIRKCTHCETTTTPQWREGPSGPKTLCNACGVRFRSGRLVPEYRPASSPTFIPSVHSNSHRKIIEMRRKGEDQFETRKIRVVSSRG